MSLIKRIPIDKVELGMYVSDQTPGMAENGLRTQGYIRRFETVDKLRATGLKELYIDVHRGIDSAFTLPTATHAIGEPRVKLGKERERAEKVYDEAKGLVTELMNNVKLGKAIDIGPVESLADDINNSVLNNPNALLCLASIREKDQYLLEHSINVGILMGILSQYLGYEQELVHQMVTGALLHDIGKIRVPYNILNKPGKLSPEEWTEMKRHVVYGQEVLLQSEGINEVALSICGMHHERLDGSGYPMGLKDYEINNYGRLAAIVDVYDAITASRVYHKGKPPAEAMGFLQEICGFHLDTDLVRHFIRCMSVYPVGTLVELDNGKLGVVISIKSENPDSPIVRCFYNARHRHHEKPADIDLSSKLIETKIIATENPEDYDFNINDFL
ncbi:HDIG domain-containing protein [Alteromonadaceae bacterium Bs31]|nr:HDIG domain-containing protein [Alteromonadaceae bacterium Bs31]